jgi:hypothetical protein
VLGEEGEVPLNEAGHGRGFLVVVELNVGEPRVGSRRRARAEFVVCGKKPCSTAFLAAFVAQIENKSPGFARLSLWS